MFFSGPRILKLVKAGDANGVLTILKQDRRLIYEKYQGLSLLFYAVTSGQTEVVRALASMGADVNEANLNESYLVTAVDLKNLPMMKALLELGARINVPGFSPLHTAAYIEDPELTCFLVESGAELNAIYEERIDGELKRQTPLDVAIFYQNMEIIVYLESQGGKKAADLGSIVSRNN